MRILALCVMLVAGCLPSDPEVSLRELPAIGLDFSTGASTYIAIHYNNSFLEPCSALRDDTYATFDGVAMTVRRGGNETEECDEPSLLGLALADRPTHTLVLADATRTITVELTDQLTPRSVTKVPAGPLDLVSGQTYTFQTNVAKDLERGLTVALRGGTEILTLPPSSGPDGLFTVTMPMRSFRGMLETWTGAQGTVRTTVSGVSCLFPTSAHYTSESVSVTLP